MSSGHVRRSRWLSIHAAAVFAFLYLPIAVLVLYSFNRQGVGGFPPHHLTLDWYRVLFADDAIWDSVLNSLQVAFAAMAIALAFGFLPALALDRAQFPGKALFRRLVLLPLDPARHHYRPVPSHVVQPRRQQTQPADHCSGTWNGADFGGDNGSLCGTAKT